MLIVFTVLIFLSIIVLITITKKVFQVKSVPHKKSPRDLGIYFKEVNIPTKNNLSLYGWWIPCKSKSTVPTIILVHGWLRNLERMMPYIENLHTSFNFLAFDARCHGSSDKDSFSSMPRFAEDIESAVDYLFSQNDNLQHIGVIGLSIGGAAAIYEASWDERVNHLITVGAFADPEEVMKLQLNGHHIPHIPLGWMILKYAQYKIGKKFKDFAPENSIRKIKAKILLIHGKDDLTAPYAHAERLYTSSVEENTSLWGIENKGHSDCHTHSEFWGRIISFMESE